MQEHAFAPSRMPAPELYARWTWVSELKLGWADVGSAPTPEEINLLVEMVNIYNAAQQLKQRVAGSKGGQRALR